MKLPFVKKLKKPSSTFLLIAAFAVGLFLLLYPSVANLWNSIHSSQAITSYVDSVDSLSKAEYDRIWQAAVEYNQRIAYRSDVYRLTEEETAEYNSLLDLSGTGIMGYIEIPVIEVNLPVYHGTDESALQVAAGHLDWTSLPVGGINSHCVLSGHRGLPSAKLFTNLNRLVEGDIFMLRVLDEVLTYEVDQILIVEPQEVEPLEIVNGEDYCTLVTCTPYGVNTHRLLVRGRRIENSADALSARITAEATQISELVVAASIALPILILILILTFVSVGVKDRRLRRTEK